MDILSDELLEMRPLELLLYALSVDCLEGWKRGRVEYFSSYNANDYLGPDSFLKAPKFHPTIAYITLLPKTVIRSTYIKNLLRFRPFCRCRSMTDNANMVAGGYISPNMELYKIIGVFALYPHTLEYLSVNRWGLGYPKAPAPTI